MWFPKKLTSQMMGEIKSRNGSSHKCDTVWSSESTARAITITIVARRTRIPASNIRLKREAPLAATHNNDHRKPKVNIMPKYPPGREERTVRPQRSW